MGCSTIYKRRIENIKRIIYINVKLKVMAKDTKNRNLGSFVDAVTPEPKIILENYFNFTELNNCLAKGTVEEKQWIQQLVDIVVSINKQEEFCSFGEQIALNTLRKLKILV